MKKLLLAIAFLFYVININAQQLIGEKITILKGGITVLRFSGDITNFKLVSKTDYNINIEEDKSIRIWAKAGVANPVATELFVTEGKRNHQFNISYKEKGDYNSTYYDYTNVNLSKNKNQISTPVIEDKPTIIQNPNLALQQELERKKQEERAKVLLEEKKRREERQQSEWKKNIEAKNNAANSENALKLQQEKEEKRLAELKKKEEDERFYAEEKMKKDIAEQKISSEKRRLKELEEQIEREKKEKELKEAALAAEKLRKQKEQELERLAKAEEINLANAKKAREENERRLLDEKRAQDEQLKAIALEKEKREQILASIEAEKRSQELLDQRIDEEKRIREAKIATERKEREAIALALEKKRIEMELAEAKRAEEARIATEKRLREESERRIALEKEKQKEAVQALLDAKKQQEELLKKLAEEKLQRESLEKMLLDEKLKRVEKEKALEREKLTNTLPIEPIKIVEPVVTKTNHTTVSNNTNITTSKSTESNLNVQFETESDGLVKPNFSNISKFPNINFNAPPTGQVFDTTYTADTLNLAIGCANILSKTNNQNYTNSSTEIDQIKINLSNIIVENDVAYISFRITNYTPDYFILGSTLLKILDAESGKKYQINPYYISTFPIVDPNGSAEVVYAMKAEKNISPDSFVMITIRERQTNKKFELNFPGNFYTDALKVKK